MLEVIDRGSSSESHPVPLLFVHGGEHAAWCWDEHFLDYFAAKGYRALALSLRGHGMSPNPKPPRASVTPQEVHATARAYHTQAEIFPNMGHDMMLEPGWVAVAQRIHTWLCTQGL